MSIAEELPLAKQKVCAWAGVTNTWAVVSEQGRCEQLRHPPALWSIFQAFAGSVLLVT